MFHELGEVLSLADSLARHCRVETLAKINFRDATFPILAFSFGSTDPTAPVLGIIGGVHGIEKIGTRIATSFLKYLESRIAWDETLQWELSRMRLVIVPIANPVGMKNFTRCNGNGVDLMRNSPIESADPTFLVGGHRISKMIPWFRGNEEQSPQGMEIEARVLADFILREIKNSRCSIVMDIHSGFGGQDQIWFPWAHTHAPFPHLAEIYSFKEMLDHVLPNHVYKVEPQSKHYTTHGDLWDYLYEEWTKAPQGSAPRLFLPLTLELGSWNWIRKNPVQFFSFRGHFNPVKPHRQKRAMRRHLPLFEFLSRVTISQSAWWPLDHFKRERYLKQAHEQWYR